MPGGEADVRALYAETGLQFEKGVFDSMEVASITGPKTLASQDMRRPSSHDMIDHG